MTNYFTLLGISEAFELDVTSLETAYFKAQRQYHPDRFVAKPQAEKMAALQTSVDINNAYETLKNPLKRAQYCLHLQGIEVGTEADSVKPSQAILVEIMELREEGVEAPVLEKMITDSLAIVSASYREKKWDAMAQETIRLSYLQKIRHDIRVKK